MAEQLGGKFTREKRVENFLKTTGWNISKDGNLYKWYDKHRIDFYRKGHEGYEVTVDRGNRVFYKGELEHVKRDVINKLIDDGLYAIRKN